MLRANQVRRLGGVAHAPEGSSVVVAGPSSALTLPGIMTSQIADALSHVCDVIRIEVNLGISYDAGLFRAPSLAVAHQEIREGNFKILSPDNSARARATLFKEVLTSEIKVAVAFVWPGLDNGWIKQYIQTARLAGISTVALCPSLPSGNQAKLVAAAEQMARVDTILVGDESDATILANYYNGPSPVIEIDEAMSLRRKTSSTGIQKIVAFLPRNGVETLSSMLAAFDAIPEAWISNYRLEIAMRDDAGVVSQVVSACHHSDFVELITSDISSKQLKALCDSASVLLIADPAVDSRAYSFAVESGTALVVSTVSELPMVGIGYMGALLANKDRPVSIHVAISHALRFAELQFPRPRSWGHLVDHLLGQHVITVTEPQVLKIDVEV